MVSCFFCRFQNFWLIIYLSSSGGGGKTEIHRAKVKFLPYAILLNLGENAHLNASDNIFNGLLTFAITEDGLVTISGQRSQKRYGRH